MAAFYFQLAKLPTFFLGIEISDTSGFSSAKSDDTGQLLYPVRSGFRYQPGVRSGSGRMIEFFLGISDEVFGDDVSFLGNGDDSFP